MIAPNFLCQTGAIRDNQNGGDRAKDRCYVGPVQFIHPEIIEYKALISIDPHKDIANFFSQFAKQTPFFHQLCTSCQTASARDSHKLYLNQNNEI
jgi:hypothetical protein